ncbi:unnamed protein product [Dibothriocephalus latus]|uniref:Uncharacterized protein n=1 Tax=Dibothriocephalus latus TaxID=60516 RepID=A0A3P7RIV9_DIBLA|nr:unnamed protein product [Dibothriocephalus latus]
MASVAPHIVQGVVRGIDRGTTRAPVAAEAAASLADVDDVTLPAVVTVFTRRVMTELSPVQNWDALTEMRSLVGLRKSRMRIGLLNSAACHLIGRTRSNSERTSPLRMPPVPRPTMVLQSPQTSGVQ